MQQKYSFAVALAQSAQELEKNIAKQQKQEQGGSDEDGEGGNGGYRFEPSILGINLKDLGSGAKLIYFAAVVAGLAGVFYIGLQPLSTILKAVGYNYLFGSGPRTQAEKLAEERRKKKEAKKAKQQ